MLQAWGVSMPSMRWVGALRALPGIASGRQPCILCHHEPGEQAPLTPVCFTLAPQAVTNAQSQASRGG
jgi:hypothetical protein